MRRRAWIATAVVAALLLAIALFKLRTSRQREAVQVQHGEHASTHKAGTRVGGASTATRNVAGTVYLEDATAAGAAVRIVALRSIYQAAKQTDAKGHFDFGPVPVDEYRVIAEIPHATGAAIPVDLRDQLLDAEKLRLIAHACDASLHGVVRDASGGVIRRARLFVAQSFDEGPGTDAGDDGAYELCVPVGDSAVIVRADGYADAFAPVSAFGRVRRDFELVPEVVVAGRAVRASDNTPVAGAQLTLQPVDFSSMQRVPSVHAFSDADGQFRFRGVAAGQFSLTATADHLASAEAMHVEADVATPAEGLECKLVATLSVAGRVIEKTSKKPVPGHELWAVAENLDNGPIDATSAADGTFVLENLAPGSYRISDTFLPRGQPTGIEVKLDKADVEDLKIEVDALGSIAGRVTRAGKPLDGVSLQPRPLDSNDRFERPPGAAISDAEGRFVVRGVAAGKYQVYAESKRVGAFTQGPIVTLAAGENKAGVDIELDLAGSIAGTVVDQKGAAVSGVHLRFSLMQGRDFGEATTADDGTFRAAALSGGGDYMFQVHAVANSRLTLRPADGAQFTPIRVRDGNSQVTGVVIKVQFERLSISGRVVAADGSPAADVAVTAERGTKGRGFIGPTATTDTSGKFAIKDLPAGKYSVYARSPSGFAHVEGVAAGASNVDLRLPTLGAIEGTLEGFATSPSVFAFARGDDVMMPYRLNATASGTTFSFKRVPVGTYVLMARSKDGSAHADVTVDGKAVAKVVLRNPGSGTVEGRVVDETTREPVANLMCEGEGSRIRTDASGAFRLERVTAGKTAVYCMGNAMAAHASVTVEVGKTAHVELAARKWGRPTVVRGYAGLELAIVANNVAVKKVVSGGPAERAEIKSGDIVREIDDYEVDPMMGPQLVLMGIEDDGPGGTVTLTLERDGKQRTVELKLDSRP